MDPRRFDALAKRLAARRLSRRAVTKGGVASWVAALAGAGAARAQDATPGGGGGTDAVVAEDNATLFVQTAAAGSFRPNPMAGPAATPGGPAGTPDPARRGAYLLTLEGHSGETIAFSDRPQRQFGEVKTPRFFDSMGFTPADPPNAALVADSPAGEDGVLLVELLNPSYDEPTRTLSYEADLLQQYEGEGLRPVAARQGSVPVAPEFGPASLFIDDCPDTAVTCFTPESLRKCQPVGHVNRLGTCWHWECLCCSLCNYGGPNDACNQHVRECAPNCVGRTPTEYRKQCG